MTLSHGRWDLLQGDSAEVLKTLPDSSVDALVTDPPAGISFMGKDWDGAKGGRLEWIAWLASIMRECHRVLKPGAHGLVWALPRTSHWTATALEDADFEIRDRVQHLFGQGFPKSLNISKAIDATAGAERPRLRPMRHFARNGDGTHALGGSWQEEPWETGPATPAAREWDGWGTALKPAAEDWWLIRKPISEKNVAANVMRWGTGGINVDGCRVGTSGGPARSGMSPDVSEGGWSTGHDKQELAKGRWPANLVLSHSDFCTPEQCDLECAVLQLDAQSGFSRSPQRVTQGRPTGAPVSLGSDCIREVPGHGDAGGASRFFYVPKISSGERNAGLEDARDRTLARSNGAKAAESDGQEYGGWSQSIGLNRTLTVKNHHPTVKPQKLMAYLCRLITPPGGIILDAFAGSGSTGCAAMIEGFRFLGIEREPDYAEIARVRIQHALDKSAAQR